MSLNIIPTSVIDNYIDRWIEEDATHFDYTAIGLNRDIKAELYMKSSGMVCGTKVVTRIFNRFNIRIEWCVPIEGVYCTIKPGEKYVLAVCIGKSYDMNLAERIALNFLQKCSGVATNAYRYSNAAKDLGFTGKIAATRKIIPGFGIFQKYGAIVGGCDSHRINITDMIMIKDNHRDQAALNDIDFPDYVRNIKEKAGFTKKLEIECRNRDEVVEAIPYADIIMLDNFTPDDVASVAAYIKSIKPNILIDVSGGINFDNMAEYFNPNVDIISISKVLDMESIDFSLKTRTSILN